MTQKKVSADDMIRQLYSLYYSIEATNFKTHPALPEYFHNRLGWNQQLVETMIAKLEEIAEQEEENED